MSRTISLTLDAKTGGFVSGLRTAAKATKDFAVQADGFQKKHSQSLNTMADGLGKAGLVGAAGLGLVTKAAMDWESAWAGVQKTVDGTPEQMNQLESGLRGLAKELPATHGEIAAVAEAAGQLGIKVGDVKSFTKVMIDLGESTNLSAEEAATSLARFSNIMGTSSSDVGRLGATLVGLGNNYATTESEIMAMSMRLAGSGKQAGLTEGQVMGLAAAMSSVGIEAEAGGTAMSMILKKIGKAVDEGGGDLETFASAAGMTGDAFSKAFQEDASGALNSVITGLDSAAASGESMNTMLSDMGIKGIREADAMLRLAAAGDLVGKAMKQGSKEYSDGTALIEEANKRYATAESKVKMAWNGIKDAAIDAGSVVLPIIKNISDGVVGFTSMLSGIPAPIHSMGMALAVIGTAGALGAAGLIKVVTAVSDFRDAWTSIASTSEKAAAMMGRLGTSAKTLGKVMGIAAIAVVGFELAVAAYNANQPEPKSMEDFAKGAANVANGVTSINDQFRNIDFGQAQRYAGEINNIGDALSKLDPKDFEGKIASFGSTHLGINNGVTILRKELEGMDKALSAMVSSGDLDGASKVFREMASSAQEGGHSIEALTPYMQEYLGSLRQIANETGLSDQVTDAEILEWALSGIPPKAIAAAEGLSGVAKATADAAKQQPGMVKLTQDQEKALKEVGLAADGAVTSMGKFLDAMFAAGLATMSSREATATWNKTLRELDGSIKSTIKENKGLGTVLNKGATDFNKNTDAGLASMKMFHGTIQEGQTIAKTYAGDMSKSQADVQKQLESTYAAGIKTAMGFGMSEEAAIALTREVMGIPEDVDINTWMDDEARIMVEALTGQILEVPTDTEITFSTNVPEVSARLTEIHKQVQSVPDKSITISENSPIVIDALRSLGYIVTTLPDGRIRVSETGTTETGEKIDRTAGKKRTATINTKTITQAAETSINKTARERTATIRAIPFIGTAAAILDNLARTRTASIHAQVTGAPLVSAALNAIAARGGRANGGKIPGLVAGGRLPATGQGTDQIMGYSRKQGRVVAMLDDTEWVINKKSSNKYDRELAMINAGTFPKLPGFATGGKLSDLRFDLQRSLLRGDIDGSLSTVDKLFQMAQDSENGLGRTARNRLMSSGYSLERQIISLTKQSEKLATQLDKATQKRDELLSVQQGVRSQLGGETTLSSVMDMAVGRESGPVTAGDVRGAFNAKRNQLQRFVNLLAQLRKMGYGASIIQQVTDMGVNEGTLMAEALLKGSKADVQMINSHAKWIDEYANQAGTQVTNSMYAGGINAAQGLVSGLESQSKKVDDAFYKLGKQAESAFKRALGIKSPSRVMMAAADDTVEGAIIGTDKAAPRLEDSMKHLAERAANAYVMPMNATGYKAPTAADLAHTNASTQQPTPQVVQENNFYYPKEDHMSRGVERANQLLTL